MLKRLRQEKKKVKSLQKSYAAMRDEGSPFSVESSSSSFGSDVSSQSSQFPISPLSLKSPDSGDVSMGSDVESLGESEGKTRACCSDYSTTTTTTPKKIKSLTQLVKNRMVIEETRELLHAALGFALSGTWVAKTERALEQILDECNEFISKGKTEFGELVTELAVLPEVYQVLLGSLINNGRDSALDNHAHSCNETKRKLSINLDADEFRGWVGIDQDTIL